MKPTEFVKVNSQFWGDHLRSVSEHLPTSHSRELPGPLVYPRLMVLTETPDWNILELVGVSREYRSLEVKRQKADSIDQYFGGASSASDAVVVLQDERVFKDATIATESARSALAARFAGAESLIGAEVVGSGTKLLQFAPGNYSTFERVLLASTADSSVRLHWTFLAIAIHRSEPHGQVPGLPAAAGVRVQPSRSGWHLQRAAGRGGAAPQERCVREHLSDARSPRRDSPASSWNSTRTSCCRRSTRRS